MTSFRGTPSHKGATVRGLLLVLLFLLGVVTLQAVASSSLPRVEIPAIFRDATVHQQRHLRGLQSVPTLSGLPTMTSTASTSTTTTTTNVATPTTTTMVAPNGAVTYKFDIQALSTTESGEALQKIQSSLQQALTDLTSGARSPLAIDSFNIRATGTSILHESMVHYCIQD
jgi:hypothetical protein